MEPKRYNTEQEKFWIDEFGTEYIARNNLSKDAVASRLAMWVKVFSSLSRRPESVLELGCNLGINLHAIKMLLPQAEITGVEINPQAAQEARKIPGAEIVEASIIEYEPGRKWDFVFTSGVLIHINPDFLPNVYSLMSRASNQYICVAEYYNPNPVSIPYRGHADKLFKRDFASELLASAPDFELRDYGFVYRHDPLFSADDLTWFLLKKKF